MSAFGIGDGLERAWHVHGAKYRFERLEFEGKRRKIDERRLGPPNQFDAKVAWTDKAEQRYCQT